MVLLSEGNLNKLVNLWEMISHIFCGLSTAGQLGLLIKRGALVSHVSSVALVRRTTKYPFFRTP
jgi:hypothetical protein